MYDGQVGEEVLLTRARIVVTFKQVYQCVCVCVCGGGVRGGTKLKTKQKLFIYDLHNYNDRLP